MKRKFYLTTVLLSLAINCLAQQNDIWGKWSWLIGDWNGEGSGQPGQGNGTFSFSFALDRNILIRKSHSEYPAAETKPKIVHNDLLIIYFDSTGNPDKGIYFDNEGHTIFYTVTYVEKSITLTSNKSRNTPIFRLTYTYLDSETVNTQFELSQDGVKFIPYIEGKSKKIKKY
jgi:hypothetical protein